jgi:hypothetical protein
MQFMINVKDKWIRWLGVLGAAALFLGGAYWVHASSVTVPFTFVNGTVADATEVNANFNALAVGINDNNNRITTLEGSIPPTLTAGTGITIVSDVVSADVGTGLLQVAAGNHNHDADYVNVLGDTMIGALTVSNTLEADVLRLGDTGGNAIKWNFQENGSNELVIGYPTERVRVTTTGTVVASGFTGDGSGLTNVLPLAGGTMTGTLVLAADPVNPFDAATQQWVLSQIGAGGGGTVTQIIAGNGLAGGTITTTGTISIVPGTLNGQVLQWNGASWAPATVSTGNADTLDGLDSTDFMAAATDNWVNTFGDTMTGNLTLAGPPSSPNDATTRTYVDSADILKLNKAGDSMIGALTLSGAPTLGNHATTRTYVDNADLAKLNLSGGTLTGFLLLSGDPTLPMHAATRQYVLANAGGSGTVTQVTAGSGLAGGPITTTGTLTLMPGTTANQVLRWVGGAWTLDMETTDAGTLDGLDSTDFMAATADNWVNTFGDTMTGSLTIIAPTLDMHAATKKYVDDSFARPLCVLTKTAETFTASTATIVTWDTENLDSSSMHAAGATSIVIPAAEDGIYEVYARVFIQGGNRKARLTIDVGGAPVAMAENSSGTATIPDFSITAKAIVQLAASNSVTVVVTSDANGGSTTGGNSCTFIVRRIQ